MWNEIHNNTILNTTHADPPVAYEINTHKTISLLPGALSIWRSAVMAIEQEYIKKYVAPAVVVLVVVCAFSIMAYPILKVLGEASIPMVSVMLTLIPSIVASVIVYYLNKPNKDLLKPRAMGIVIHFGFAVILSAIIGLLVAAIVTWVTGADISVGRLGPFLWLASFALMTVVLGSVNWFRRYGIAIPAVIVLLGMSTIQVPVGMLPGFWQNWVAPWVPQRYIADGVKDIALFGSNDLGDPVLVLSITAITGVVLLITAVVRPVIRDMVLKKKETET
jgi:hypothetical protein